MTAITLIKAWIPFSANNGEQGSRSKSHISSSMYAVANTTGVKRTQPIILSVDALNIVQSGSGLKFHSQTT